MDVEHLERALARETAAAAGGHAELPEPHRRHACRWPRAARCCALAREAGAVVVENDIYGELRYAGEPLPSLKQLDEAGDTVLLRSFSKVAFPGLRVGWVIGAARR